MSYRMGGWPGRGKWTVRERSRWVDKIRPRAGLEMKTTLPCLAKVFHDGFFKSV